VVCHGGEYCPSARLSGADNGCRAIAGAWSDALTGPLAQRCTSCGYCAVYAYIVHRLSPADACSLTATRDLAGMRIVESVGHGGGG